MKGNGLIINGNMKENREIEYANGLVEIGSLTGYKFCWFLAIVMCHSFLLCIDLQGWLIWQWVLIALLKW